MKFNYKLKRLCGAYYGHFTSSSTSSAEQAQGSNVVFDSTGNLLISAVSNRIQVLDLKSGTVRTLPIEARSSIAQLALSPDDTVLATIDDQHYALLIHFHRGIVLHRFRADHRVRDVQFSPNGHYLAISSGKRVQVWQTPSAFTVRQVAPLVLHRTVTGLAEAITCVAWSPDGSVLVAGDRSGALRVWTLHTTLNYAPITCAGHKRAIVGVYILGDEASSNTGLPPSFATTALTDPSTASKIPTAPSVGTIMSISEDGALVTWTGHQQLTNSNDNSSNEEDDDEEEEEEENNSHDRFRDASSRSRKRRRRTSEAPSPTASQQPLLSKRLVGAVWTAAARHYLTADGGAPGARVSSASYCPHARLLAVGFTSGLFGVYELPSVANVHTLSVGAGQLVRACSLNRTGEWLALGCPSSQQLLVWEWRSETYVIKQRGHAYGMRCMAYSPDGIVVATGGEDGKLKLWNATSGFCYVTLEQSHTAPVTRATFASSSVVLTASLDGTVRAHDLHRYRTFRTLTTPTPVQFLSLAVDPAGEIVAAGCTDPFHVYVWNLQTGKLLDVLTGHSGPVCDLAFTNHNQSSGTLVSASWDGTVKIWDLYKTDVPTESLSHASDVVCVACRPDGKELCSGTVGGLLSFWDVESGKLKFEIDGRRDISGGRKRNDRMTSDNNAASRYFTSICYSADGSCILAGGNSKYVCIYEVSQQVLLKKFQVTHNRSLDGVLDELNSKQLGDFGPLADPEDSDDDATNGAAHLPGAKRGDDGSRSSKVEILTVQVSFSSNGREWAAVSGEGLHVYSLDDDMVFDPISLTEDVTPAAILQKLGTQEYGAALHMSLHLNECALVRQVLDDVPFQSIPLVVQNLRLKDVELERLVHFLGNALDDSPHIEFYVQWCLQLLMRHGLQLDRRRSYFLRALRSMHKAMQTRAEDAQVACDSNTYTMEVLQDHLPLLEDAPTAEAAI